MEVYAYRVAIEESIDRYLESSEGRNYFMDNLGLEHGETGKLANELGQLDGYLETFVFGEYD